MKVECNDCKNVGVYKKPNSLNYHCPMCGLSGLFQQGVFTLLEDCDLKPIQGEWIQYPCPNCDQGGMVYRFLPSGLVQCPKCETKLLYKLPLPVKSKLNIRKSFSRQGF